MKKNFTLGCVGLVIVVCALGGYAVKSMQPPPPKTEVAPVAVQRGDLTVQVVETGTLNADNVVELKSLVSGRLKALYVDEGDSVKQGQLIAIIDPRETQLAVDQTRAQMEAAQNQTERSQIEMEQRVLSAKSDLASAQSRLLQAQEESKAQPELTRTAIAQARTQLATAEKEQQRILQSAEPNQRVAAQSSIDEAKSNLANAQAELDRDQTLLKKGYVSKKQVEDDQLQVELSQTRLQSAKDNYNTLTAGFDQEQAKADQSVKQAQAVLDSAVANSIQDRIKREAYLSAVADRDKAVVALRDVDAMKKGIQQNQATVRQYSSALQDGQRNLGETEIRSPFTGLVTKKDIRVGELVTSISGFSSGTAIVRIEDRKRMKVQLDVNEIDAARMVVGMPVNVTVDALPDTPFKGVVTKIAPSSTAMDSADSSSGSSSTTSTADTVVKYKIEVVIDNPSKALRSGMSSKCSFIVDKRTNVLNVPLEYIGHDDKGDYVMISRPSTVKGQPPTGERRAVVAGLRTSTSVEIKSGIEDGTLLLRPDYKGPKRQGAMGMGGDN